MPARICPACGRELTRHRNERPAHFRDRKYCNLACSVAGRTLRAQEAQSAADMVQSDRNAVFDRAELLRVAHRAAPQVPVSLLADVLDRVEPLIAANTRRRLMAHVAVNVNVREARA